MSRPSSPDPGSVALEVTQLTKRFGAVTAVEDLSFSVTPGRVTGFLGPNGSGKTTTLRCLLGLVTPTSGQTRVGSADYRSLPEPIRTVGAALESSNFHPARSALNHLRIQCLAAGLDPNRADECLALVGLNGSARRKVGEYSLGMRQRLSLAAALLGEPVALVLDEPTNGLDPAGIAWLRGFLRAYAAAGRTVLVSSHALAEVSATVDDVVIISEGRLVHAGPLESLLTQTNSFVSVNTPQADRLAIALGERFPTAHVARLDDNRLHVTGLESAAVGRVAFDNEVELHELSETRTDLEEIFLHLTSPPTDQPSHPTWGGP